MTPYCTCYRNWWKFLDCNIMVSPEVVPLYLQPFLIPNGASHLHKPDASEVNVICGCQFGLCTSNILWPFQNTKKVSHHKKSAWNSASRCIQCSSCFVFVAMCRKISCHFESHYMHERVSPINDSKLFFVFFCSCVALASTWSIYSPSSGNLISPFSVSSTIPKNDNTAWRGTLYLVDF